MILVTLLLVYIFSTVTALSQSQSNGCLYNLPMPTKPDPEDCVGYFALYDNEYIQQYCPPGAKYSDALSCCITGRCPPCNCQTTTTISSDSTTSGNDCSSIETTSGTASSTISDFTNDSTEETTGSSFEDSSPESPQSSSTSSSPADYSTDTSPNSEDTTNLSTETTLITNASDGTTSTTEVSSDTSTSQGTSTMTSSTNGQPETSPTVSTDYTTNTNNPITPPEPPGGETTTKDTTTDSTPAVTSTTESTTDLTATTTSLALTTTDSTPAVSSSTYKTTTTGPAPPSCENLKTGTFLPDPVDCNRYYVCSYGQAILMHCPPTLWFDVKLNVCNYPEKVTCDASGRPETSPDFTTATTFITSTTTDSTPAVTSSTESTTVLTTTTTSETPTTSHSTSTESTTVLTTTTTPDTPATTDSTPVVNSTTESTTDLTTTTTPDAPTATDSTPAISSSTYQTTTTSPAPPSCENLKTGTFLPDPVDCNRYYVCSYGQAIRMRCPSTLWFDVKLNVCNYPEKVTCDASGHPETSTTFITSTTTDSTPAVTSSTVLTTTTTPETPTTSHSTPTVTSSTESTTVLTTTTTTTPETPVTSDSTPAMTSSSESTTDLTSKTSTTTISSSTYKTTTTGTAPPSCANLKTGTFLPDPVDCNRYYVCSYGQAIRMRCPSTLWFDVKLDVCNYPENVTCVANQNRIQILRNRTNRCFVLATNLDEMEKMRYQMILMAFILMLPYLRVTNAEIFEECENEPDDTFVKSSQSCQMYIYCNGDDSYSGECDEGQYFDGDACDDAENVYCFLDDIGETDPEDPVESEEPEDPEETEPAVTTRPTAATTTEIPQITTNNDLSTSTLEAIVVAPVVRDHCPTVEDPQTIVFTANNQSCTGYYLCYHGQAIEMRCTDNLHFNIHTAKCDFPENVQCMMDRPNANKCLPQVTDFFPHPQKCNYFYYCIKGFLTVQQCPFYYGWDIERRACVLLDQAKCFEGSRPSNTSCRHYIYCGGEESYEGECADGDYFNELLQTCDPEQFVTCQLYNTSSPSPSSMQTAPTQAAMNTTASSTFSSTVIASSPSAPTQTTSNQTSSDNTSTTSALSESIATSEAPPVTKDAIAIIITTECPLTDNPNQMIFVPHPKTCSDYFICYRGQQMAMHCSSMLHFNSNTGKCDYAENVRCQEVPMRIQFKPMAPLKVVYICLAWTTIIQQSQSYTSNSIIPPKKGRQNNICLNHTAGEFDRNPDDCRSFYLCLENGQAVMAPCPPTMLFNAVSKLCDTAENVNCDISIPSASNNNNTNSNNNGNTDDDDKSEALSASRYCVSLQTVQNRIVFVGSNSNCQQYFICYYGQAVLQECSANLHWNKKIDKCDLPEKAGCEMWNGDVGIGQYTSVNGIGENANTADALSNGSEYGAQSTISELINCPIYGQHVFPHMSRCEYFIYCIKGHASLQKCPFYHNFDIVSKSCKWRTTAVCIRDLNINLNKLIAK
ncbi:uncharacterized protein LOC120778426 [Bactrocera tryoni]|uniref:uncharacterized protein LOC120778426 n=1 Tax=Bactrocera tryoni TaxID=59916 RepID=UPI001A998DEC|nr:uncharacterized protein LOC120778426 [Bactrocera tryoni]